MKNNSDEIRKRTFCYRFNFTEQIKLLECVQQVVLILENVERYCNGEELEKGDKLTDMVFANWKTFVDEDEERREEKKRRLSERGKRGAKGRWAKPSQPDIPFVEAEEVERYPFEAFWDLYDKKLDTTKCKKIWRRISDEDKAQIMAHAAEYVAATPGKQYRRNPYNYLCNRGWEDEIIQQNYGNNHIQQDRRSERQINAERNAKAMAKIFADLDNGKRHNEATENEPF